MVRWLVVTVWLAALWVLLWRDTSAGTVVAGLLVALLAGLVIGLGPLSGYAYRVRPLALLRFSLYFAVKLLEANLVLAKEVITPRNSIVTGVIAVPLPECSDLVVLVVANSVSLTPGTLTIEVGPGPPPTLYIHVLHLHDIEQARRSVRHLTHLVQAAFPSTSSTSGTSALQGQR